MKYFTEKQPFSIDILLSKFYIVCEIIHRKSFVKTEIPKPTLARLVKLSRLLEQIASTEGESAVISSAEIEGLTGWTRDTVRRDISFLNASCAKAGGYDVLLLKQTIQSRIAVQTGEAKCCLVGLGRLGEALINYGGFDGTAFSMVAGFDSNVNRTEILSAPFPLYTTTKMQAVIAAQKIEYAILAVPTSAAQSTAQKLAEYGIKGIVNFTPVVLSLPANIKIENVSVLDALQKLAAERAVLGETK